MSPLQRVYVVQTFNQTRKLECSVRYSDMLLFKECGWRVLLKLMKCIHSQWCEWPSRKSSVCLSNLCTREVKKRGQAGATWWRGASGVLCEKDSSEIEELGVQDACEACYYVFFVGRGRAGCGRLKEVAIWVTRIDKITNEGQLKLSSLETKVEK